MTAVAIRPDAEAAVHDWLLARSRAGDIPTDPPLGTNIFYGAPRSNAYPRIQLSLVASTDDDYVDVYGEDEVQIDVVATSKQQASRIVRTVAALVKALVDGTPMGSDAIGKGARVVLGPMFRPEDARITTADGKPPAKGTVPSRSVARYVLGARFSLIPSA